MSEEQIRQLSKSVKNGFDKIDRRFTGIDKKLSGIDQKLTGHDKVFDKIDQRLSGIDQKLTGHDKAFERFYKYMGEFRSEVNTRLDAQDKKIDAIYNILDAHLKRIEEILQENAIRDRQQDRMERWIFQLADKMNLKLKYEP